MKTKIKQRYNYVHFLFCFTVRLLAKFFSTTDIYSIPKIRKIISRQNYKTLRDIAFKLFDNKNFFECV